MCRFDIITFTFALFTTMIHVNAGHMSMCWCMEFTWCAIVLNLL